MRLPLDDCLKGYDLRLPMEQQQQQLPTNCQEAVETHLPANANILRFLDQFEGQGIEESVEKALRDAFSRMLQDGEASSNRTNEFFDLRNADIHHGDIPDGLPLELRREILRNMLLGRHFRPTLALRLKLQAHRQQLLRSKHYAAAYWIDRLLTH
ncbi:uncharacterized protein LOC118458983 [Anopheles albimanus]|uniref:uncharacterized protein LOC118458983 n=1 Tax=Anopheles albimanus TaxID=7167 RepID=UPI00163E909B|nr:uncharacterized protein LOC118458983 [Anopheles albimanus]